MKRIIEQIAADGQQAELLKRDRRIRELEESVRRHKQSSDHALKQLESAEQALGIKDAIDDARDPIAWENDKRTNASPYCAIAVASDWHVGESIEAKAVGGRNVFNPSIAAKRIRKFFLKIPEYVERYAPESKLLVLHAGGDFISGHIHPDLAESNNKSPTEECLWFFELWSDGLVTLLKNLRANKIVIPTSIGNHGRTTQKPRVTTAARTSYEQMIYKLLASRFKDKSRIEWRISEGYHNTQSIFGRKVRFHHGDAIQYAGGVGGITIPVRKAVAQWNKSERVDLDVFGHFHEYLDGGSFVCNGSLVGYSPFSVKIKAEYQPPIQAFLVFDRKHGLRQSTRIFVDD